MISHIVKYNERVEDILNMYHIELDELKNHNTHITDFNRLLSGSKLMIPIISREVEQVLDKTEGFVMDYYPKISEEIIPNLDDKPEPKEKEVITKPNNIEPRKENNIPITKTAYPGVLPPKRPYRGRM